MAHELPEDLRDDFSVVREGRVTSVVRDDFEAEFRRLGLAGAADDPPVAGSGPRVRPFRPDGGRGAMARISTERHGDVVVRPCRRGGLPARLAERRYFVGRRSLRELAVTERLRRRGVPTVEPLAAVHSPRTLGYRAAMVTRLVPDAPPAPARLRGLPGEACRREMGRMGRSVGRLLAEGGFHPDLNADNLLLPEDPDRPAVLLDFDRARALGRDVPRLLARWTLRRLRRSLRKLELRGALEAWDALLEGVAGGRPG